MEVILSVTFNYDASNGVRRLLEDFKGVVKLCIGYALGRRVTSYDKLRKSVYEVWKRRWGYWTHLCHSACKVALAILKGYRRRGEEGKPEAGKLFMLDPQLYKFYGGRLNRRLHSWSFRRLQSYIEYEAELSGSQAVCVNHENTSSLFPICGETLDKALSGRRLSRCFKCGLEGGRDVIACLNLVGMRWAPPPPKAAHEAFKAGAGWAVMKC